MSDDRNVGRRAFIENAPNNESTSHYENVVDFLEKQGYSCNQEKYIITWDDYPVMTEGDMMGHTLAELKRYISKVQGKETEFWDE